MTNTLFNQDAQVQNLMADSGGYLVSATYTGYSALFFNGNGQTQSDSFDHDGVFQYSTDDNSTRLPDDLTEGEMEAAPDIF